MPRKSTRGRPAGASQDRQAAIRTAASQAFDELGYDRASIREIASRAQVDPKLVLHYFGSKPELFAATMQIPKQSNQTLEILRATPRSEWGRAFASAMMTPDGRVNLPPLVGVLRSATSDPKVAEVIREFYIKASMGQALEAIGVDHAQVRAASLSPLLAGFVFADQILEIPFDRTTDAARRRTLFEEAVQSILTTPLD